jgi:hypothetical protein
VRHIDSGNAEDAAQMVKLVDTPASGAGDRKVVEVRVFFWAPIQASRFMTLDLTETRESGFLRFSSSKTYRHLLTACLHPSPQAAHENRYRLSLLQVFATRQ